MTSKVLTPTQNVQAQAVAGQSSTGDVAPLNVNADGSLKVGLTSGDVEIGAVELKDATTDVRANITPANTARAATDNVLLVQTIGADGSVGTMTTTPANTARTATSEVVSVQQIDELGVVGGTTLKTKLAGEDTSNQVFAMQRLPLAASTYSPTVDFSAALEASSVSKAGAGTLISALGRLDSTAPTGTYYIQAMNHASLPANGAVNHLVAPIKIQHVNGIDDYWDFKIHDLTYDIWASTGITFDISTTEFTKTISGAYLSMTIITK